MGYDMALAGRVEQRLINQNKYEKTGNARLKQDYIQKEEINRDLTVQKKEKIRTYPTSSKICSLQPFKTIKL